MPQTHTTPNAAQINAAVGLLTRLGYKVTGPQPQVNTRTQVKPRPDVAPTEDRYLDKREPKVRQSLAIDLVNKATGWSALWRAAAIIYGLKHMAVITANRESGHRTKLYRMGTRQQVEGMRDWLMKSVLKDSQQFRLSVLCPPHSFAPPAPTDGGWSLAMTMADSLEYDQVADNLLDEAQKLGN